MSWYQGSNKVRPLWPAHQESHHEHHRPSLSWTSWAIVVCAMERRIICSTKWWAIMYFGFLRNNVMILSSIHWLSCIYLHLLDMSAFKRVQWYNVLGLHYSEMKHFSTPYLDIVGPKRPPEGGWMGAFKNSPREQSLHLFTPTPHAKMTQVNWWQAHSRNGSEEIGAKQKQPKGKAWNEAEVVDNNRHKQNYHQKLLLTSARRTGRTNID
jgi:hypothetical protein